MCSPCRTMSSPTLTMAVTSDGGTTSTSPRRKRAAPTPPARAVITGQKPTAASGGRRGSSSARPALPSAAVPVRVAVDATPLLGTRTGVGRFVEGLLGGLASRPEIDLRAYGLTWRGRGRLAGAVPWGVDVETLAMPASPLMRVWAAGDGPAAEWWTGRVDVVHGSNFVVPPTRHAAEVVSVHDLTTVRFPEMCAPSSLRYPGLVRRAIQRGAYVVTPSTYIATEVVELLGADPSRTRAIHYGLTAPAGGPDEPPARRTGPPIIVALGTVEPRKDIPLLVQAF